MKRAEERKNSTRCFVCRELSHAAKDCPHAIGEGARARTLWAYVSGVAALSTHYPSAAGRIRTASSHLPLATSVPTKATWRPSAHRTKAEAYTQMVVNARCVAQSSTWQKTVRRTHAA